MFRQRFIVGVLRMDHVAAKQRTTVVGKSLRQCIMVSGDSKEAFDKRRIMIVGSTSQHRFLLQNGILER